MSEPRMVTTIGNLSLLPSGAVIRTDHGRIMEYVKDSTMGDFWITPGYLNEYEPIIDWLPAAVLWEPHDA